jgi:hypothetical protein
VIISKMKMKTEELSLMKMKTKAILLKLDSNLHHFVWPKLHIPVNVLVLKGWMS